MSSYHKCRTVEARARRQEGPKSAVDIRRRMRELGKSLQTKQTVGWRPSGIPAHVPSVPGSTATEVMGIHRRLFKKMQAPTRPGFPPIKAGVLRDSLDLRIGGQPVYMRDGNTGTIYRVQPKAGKPLCRTLQGGW